MTTPTPDYEAILADQGMPTTEAEVVAQFTALAQDEGLITNTSTMSPFWRLVTAIVTAPVLWLKDALVNTVMTNLFLATAGGVFVDLFAWAVNLARKDATAAEGVLRFTKADESIAVTVPAGTLIQTERINGTLYQLQTTAAVTIAAGQLSAQVPVIAGETGAGHNLAPGYYRILPEAIDGIAGVVNEEDWLTTLGADTEHDDELRDRTRNQFNLVGSYHVDAVYRALVAAIAGMTTDRIFFEHDAPRGPGTANVYLLLDTGVASDSFIDAVNDTLMTQGYHGHGDDVLCLAMPETVHALTVTVFINADSHLDEEDAALLLTHAGHLVRCAFRENSDYDVQKTWPHSRFSMSRLGEALHAQFPDIESVTFSQGDIVSDLAVPRLASLTVVEGA